MASAAFTMALEISESLPEFREIIDDALWKETTNNTKVANFSEENDKFPTK